MDDVYQIPMPSSNDPALQQLHGSLIETSARVTELEHQLRRIARTCEVFRVALQRAGVTEADLAGIEDVLKQRRDSGPPLCKKCGRVLQVGTPNCIYCGTPHLQRGGAFS